MKLPDIPPTHLRDSKGWQLWQDIAIELRFERVTYFQADPQAAVLTVTIQDRSTRLPIPQEAGLFFAETSSVAGHLS